MPFPLLLNGDIYEQIFTNLDQRGWHTLALTWTKGHATATDIQIGRTTRAEAKENKAAHDAADDAYSLYDDTDKGIRSFLAHAHKHYVALVKDIQQVLLDSTSLLQEALDEAEKAAKVVEAARKTK